MRPVQYHKTMLKFKMFLSLIIFKMQIKHKVKRANQDKEANLVLNNASLSHLKDRDLTKLKVNNNQIRFDKMRTLFSFRKPVIV